MDRKDPVTVTREELYRQVWEKPMVKLSAEYGISDNGLAKICDRLQVPYPPRGYWAKKASGQKVVEFKLPEAKPDTPPNVRITPTPKSAAVSDTPEIRAVNELRASIGEITVSQRLSRPHPIIAGWLETHKRRRQETKAEPWRLKEAPSKFSDSDNRRHLLLDALFKAVEKHGGKAIEDNQRSLCIEVNKQKIEIQLSEKSKQIKRVPTESEKRYRALDANGLVRDLQPCGLFAFSIKTLVPLRQEWIERKDKTMEGFLPEIVSTLIAAGPILDNLTKKRIEEQHRRQAAELKAYDEQQKRKREENRWRCFTMIAKQWRDVNLAREFVAAIRSDPKAFDGEIDGRTLENWLAWAETRISQSDPLLIGSNAVFNTVAKVNEWSRIE